MRRKYDLLVLISCLCAALLTGCGNTQPTEQSSTPATPTATPVDTAEAESAEEILSVFRGCRTGETSYACESANLLFILPNGWEWLSDEELMEIFDINAQALAASGEPFPRDIPVAYDIVAQDPKTGCSITIAYDNLALLNDGASYTPESYLAMIRDSLKETFDGKVEILDKYTLADHAFAGLRMITTDESLTQYCFTRTLDRYPSYMLNITIAVTEDAALEDILHAFSIYSPEAAYAE